MITTINKMVVFCPYQWCFELRYKYKEDYERFKLYVTLVNLISALIIWFFVKYRQDCLLHIYTVTI